MSIPALPAPAHSEFSAGSVPALRRPFARSNNRPLMGQPPAAFHLGPHGVCRPRRGTADWIDRPISAFQSVSLRSRSGKRASGATSAIANCRHLCCQHAAPSANIGPRHRRCMIGPMLHMPAPFGVAMFRSTSSPPLPHAGPERLRAVTGRSMAITRSPRSSAASSLGAAWRASRHLRKTALSILQSAKQFCFRLARVKRR